MFTLIGLGTGAAYLDSLIATVFPQMFPPSFRDMHGAVPVYFEAAAVITALVLLGQVLELRARQRTSGAIRALLNLAPQQAHRTAADGSEKDISLSEVQPAIACACVLASAFPWTARSWKVQAQSMNRWSPANPCP